ncbi:hypothetical protein [Solimonas terrae]|uniref:Sarcosine oxidase subunit gamma n=1 Tax=Solimonas terrae TaxID=1396819 RepID=A0A6M2BP85_9GAMM|nr:hypothetical protein [Solimonas terrae]NGY04130.1 hypothetical protein [Solimonas terrae]
MSDQQAVFPVPQSPFGTQPGATARTFVDAAHVRIVEEPFLRLISVRFSRQVELAAVAERLQLSATQAPNSYLASAGREAARYEPRAWLLIGGPDDALPSAVAGSLVTDLSARLASFRIGGTAATRILGSSTSVCPAPGGFVRTLFAESYPVLLQCLGVQDFRLLVDVSLASACADWLTDAATLSTQA